MCIRDSNNPGITANDGFKPVVRYFDRITRPEQIISSIQQAIQVMLDPADCGPACISLSQDVQGEVFEYPEDFFKERVHVIRRPKPDDYQIKEAAELIKKSKKPLIISGGGVFYSDATDELSSFATKHNIPVTQTVMGYSTMKKDHSHYLGAIGGFAVAELKASRPFFRKTLDSPVIQASGLLLYPQTLAITTQSNEFDSMDSESTSINSIFG